MNRAVFLDRDGILNRVNGKTDHAGPPLRVEEFELLSADSHSVNSFSADSLIADIKSGEYLPIAVTKQSKILEAGDKFNINFAESFLIGDSDKDLAAGKRAGVSTILIQTDYNLDIHGLGDFNCDSLDEVRVVLKAAHTTKFLNAARSVINGLDLGEIESAVDLLADTRQNGGRLFIIGSGGGAGHASHAVCDFRKLCGIESYCPTDNISELTARVNDEGWSTTISNWLKGSRINSKDAVLVFSVGGGCEEKQISTNLVEAMKLAKQVGARVIGVVGRDGGYTAKAADALILIPTVDSSLVTPLTESFQALAWHLMVSHPKLSVAEAKWEGVTK